MIRVVVALAGPTGSGKTTVARAVEQATGATRLGFGDLVRAEVYARGLGDTRSEWQEVGSAMLATLGPDGLVAAALERRGLTADDVPVVWDGVRHPEVAHALRRLYAPTRVVLAVLQPPEHERRERVLREAGSIDQLHRWECHDTERHLGELSRLADIICRTANTDEAVETILRVLAVPACERD